MGLSVGGLALLLLLIMMIMAPVGRIGIVLAALLGATLPLSADIARGAAALSSSLAPVLNALGGGGVG